MARHKAAKKALRQSKRANVRNRMATSAMNTAIKRVMGTKNKEGALAALQAAVAVIDRNVGKDLISRNTAARKKSQLYRVVKALTK